MRKIKTFLKGGSAKSRKAFYAKIGIAVFVLLVIGTRRSMIVINTGESIAAPKQAVKAAPEEREVKISTADLDQTIDRAAGYLNMMCDESGKFTYRINMNPKVQVKEQYNLLRHAGSVYSLGMYERVKPSAETRAVMKRAVRFLLGVTDQVEGDTSMKAVWSDPELTREEKFRTAKLGGAGLGLVALMSMENIEPGTTPLEEIRLLGRFVLFMQNPDGSFCSRYVPATGGKDPTWSSLYYPGEAALGLVMLYEKDPDPVWLESSLKAMGYLANIRAGKKNIEHDHWALLATAKLIPYLDQNAGIASRELILNHALQICESILDARADISEFSINHGAFSHNATTTPTAIRLEGLLAVLPFVPEGEGELKARMVLAIKAGIGFLIRSQVRSGPFTGAIPHAMCPLSKEGTPLLADIPKTKNTEVRVDYVQHALSALIQYQNHDFDTLK